MLHSIAWTGLLAIGGATVIVPSTAAMAATRVTTPADAGTSLAIAVTGQITPACTLVTPSGTSSFGDITDRRTGTASAEILSLAFTMECNTPYEASLTSANGGLAFDGTVQSAFAQIVEYAAALDMGDIAGGLALHCDSAAMRTTGERASCRGVSADGDAVVASGEGHVRLRLKPGQLPLQMGQYSDRLVLRIAPRVSG